MCFKTLVTMCFKTKKMNTTPTELPEQLNVPAARKLFSALEKAGFVGADWKPAARFFWDDLRKKEKPRIWDICYMAALFQKVGITDYADAFQTFWGLKQVAHNAESRKYYAAISENAKALDRFFENYQNE